MSTNETDPLLQAYVDRGTCRCPACAYELQGLRSDRCPECGETIRLSLKGDSDRRSGWLVGLVSLSSMFGLFGLFVPLTMIIRSGPPTTMWALYLGALLSWPSMIFWLVARRRFPRWPKGVRRALSTGAVLLVALFMLLALAQM